MRLDIGCGKEPKTSFVGVDLYTEATIKAAMWLLPFEDDSVDEIFSSHALEHIPKKYVPITLAEWFRVLSPGGIVTLRVPCLEWCCKHWLETKTDGWDMDVIFGNQDHDGEFHKTGFWKDRLFRLVIDAGFTVVDYNEIETHNQKTLEIIFTK